MALRNCHIAFPPLRAFSFRPKLKPHQLPRIHFPKYLVLFHGTNSSAQTTQLSTTPTTWVDRLPQKINPYLYLTRIDKPIGILLLFYPCGMSPHLLIRVGELYVTDHPRIPNITAWPITVASYVCCPHPSHSNTPSSSVLVRSSCVERGARSTTSGTGT